MKLLLVALVACGQPEPAPAEPAPLVPLAVAAPVEHPRFSAVVISKESQVVTAEFDGRVVALHVQAGQQVHAGDAIAELDDTALRAQLAGARAEETTAAGDGETARSELVQQEREASVTKRLAQMGAASMESVRTAANESATKQGHVHSANGREAAAKAKRLELERLLTMAKLTAPFDGVIATINVKKGELAHKGAAIVRLVDPKDLVIRFAVPRGVPVVTGMQVHAMIDGLHNKVTALVRSLSRMDPPSSYSVVDADLADAHDARDIPVSAVGFVELD